jgi:Tol biopolymer transport system component
LDVDYPDVLPGGDWILFTASVIDGNWSSAEILAQNIATGERRTVLRGGHFARYVPTGHLVFARDATLHAVAFDPTLLETRGPIVPVVQGIATDESSGHAKFAVARNGTLIYVAGTATSGLDRSVVLLSRDGTSRALSGDLRSYANLRVSPDGARIAIEVDDAEMSSQIWIMDVATGGATRLTFEGTRNRFPVWTPDSRDVLFASDRNSLFAIYRQAADGTGEAVRVLEGTEQLVPTDVLSDSVLLYQDVGEGGYRDIFTLDLGGGEPVPFLATPDDERSARISPDGSWVVYTSNRGDVIDPRLYVRPYPRAAGGLRAIGEGNGAAPIWAPSGEEIYYVGPPPSALTVVPVTSTATTLTPGTPSELFDYGGRFELDLDALSAAPYDVMPDGGGLVGVQLSGLAAAGAGNDATRPRIHVVVNWFEELKRLVPTE